jgi:hypothetical protein
MGHHDRALQQRSVKRRQRVGAWTLELENHWGAEGAKRSSVLSLSEQLLA